MLWTSRRSLPNTNLFLGRPFSYCTGQIYIQNACITTCLGRMCGVSRRADFYNFISFLFDVGIEPSAVFALLKIGSSLNLIRSLRIWDVFLVSYNGSMLNFNKDDFKMIQIH